MLRWLETINAFQKKILSLLSFPWKAFVVAAFERFTLGIIGYKRV